MRTLIKFVIVMVVLLVVVARTNAHNIALDWLETKMVLHAWADRKIISVVTEYAVLPQRDRELIERECAPAYNDYRLDGPRARFVKEESPTCFALMQGGWTPNWTVRDYLDDLAER